MATFDLIGDYAIKQGVTYDFATFYYPEDVSTWTPRGQIRKLPYSDLLAEFSFAPLVFSSITLPDDSIGDRTIIIPILSATQTSLLPITNPNGKTLVQGFNTWVYDIELESPTGKVICLVSGLVKVLPEVSHA